MDYVLVSQGLHGKARLRSSVAHRAGSTPGDPPAMPPNMFGFLQTLACVTPIPETDATKAVPAPAQPQPTRRNVSCAASCSCSGQLPRIGGRARQDKSALPVAGGSQHHRCSAPESSGLATGSPAPRTWSWGEWNGAHGAGDSSASSCSVAGETEPTVDDEPYAYYSDELDWPDDGGTTEEVTRLPGELWVAKDVYPCGMVSLLDEENLHAARDYQCPCGKECLKRVSFIELYEHRKECVRCFHATPCLPHPHSAPQQPHHAMYLHRHSGRGKAKQRGWRRRQRQDTPL